MSNSKTTHAVIFWEGEKSFSCVKLSKIENLNIPVGEMVGHEFQIKWNKVFETGKVMGTGSKAEMKKLEDDLAEKAAELSFTEAELNESLKLSDRKKRARKNPFGSESVVSPKKATMRTEEISVKEFISMLSSVETSAEVVALPSSDAAEVVKVIEANQDESRDIVTAGERLSKTDRHMERSLIDKENQIAELLTEVHQLKKLNRKLSKIAKKSATTNVSSNGIAEKLNIGGGVELDLALVELTKLSHLSKPSMFLRKLLFEGDCFELSAIADSSLTGKISPMFPNLKRKALDPVKFGALKAFTIQTCGLQKGTLEMINFEQKLKNIPGDARKKLKNLQKST